MALSIFLEETDIKEVGERPVYKMWQIFMTPYLKLFRGYIATNDFEKTIKEIYDAKVGTYVQNGEDY